MELNFKGHLEISWDLREFYNNLLYKISIDFKGPKIIEEFSRWFRGFQKNSKGF